MSNTMLGIGRLGRKLTATQCRHDSHDIDAGQGVQYGLGRGAEGRDIEWPLFGGGRVWSSNLD